MGTTTIVFITIFVVACTQIFTSAALGLPGRRQLLPGVIWEQFKADLRGLTAPTQDLTYSDTYNAWVVSGGIIRPSPPPPATTFNRAQITPLTAAVGLVIAGFATGLLVIALLLWAKNSVDWDFTLKDVIMVMLGRRRQMPVVPWDSFSQTRASAEAAAATAAAALQEGERGGLLPSVEAPPASIQLQGELQPQLPQQQQHHHQLQQQGGGQEEWQQNASQVSRLQRDGFTGRGVDVEIPVQPPREGRDGQPQMVEMLPVFDIRSPEDAASVAVSPTRSYRSALVSRDSGRPDAGPSGTGAVRP